MSTTPKGPLVTDETPKQPLIRVINVPRHTRPLPPLLSDDPMFAVPTQPAPEPNAADRLLATAMRDAKAFMLEDDWDDQSSKLERISESLIALDELLAGGAPLPARWAR